MDYKAKREEFVEPLGDSLKKAYKLLFTKVDYYQIKTGIIFEEMTESEFLAFTVKELIDNSSASANVKVNLLRKYTDYIGKDFIKLRRDDLIRLTEAKLNNKDTNENEVKYVCMNDLKANLNKFDNDIDKAIILLIRNGICGAKFSELINLKSKDIDIENRKIYLQDRTFDIVDDYMLKVLEDAIQQKTYYIIQHREEIKNTEYDFNMNCEYLIKQRPITKNNNGLDPYRFSGITGRIYRLTEMLELGISSINLLQSNAVDKLINEENRRGKLMSMAETKEYLHSIGIKQYYYQINHMARYIREKYGR